MLKRFKKEEFQHKINEYKDLIGLIKFRKQSCIKNISTRIDLVDIFEQFKKDYPKFNHYNYRDIVYTLVMCNDINDLNNIPTCSCGKLCVPKSYKCGYDIPTYRNNCYDKICIGKSMCITLKDSIRAKYGVDNISTLKEIKQKKMDTCFRHYGVFNPMKNPDSVKKLSESMKLKYGIDNISKLEEIKQKKIQTFIKHYGSVKDAYRKIFHNYYKKCGIKNISELYYIKDKKRETFIKHYGVDNIFKDPETIQYIKDYWKENVDLFKKNYEKISESIKKSKSKITNYRKGYTGLMEFDILNEIEDNIGIKIYRQVGVMQYYMDGYIQDYNIMIEYDEPNHKRQQAEDKQRQDEIIDYIGCSVIRISEDDWLINPDNVIAKIQNAIQTIKNLNNVPKLILENKGGKLRVRKGLS